MYRRRVSSRSGLRRTAARPGAAAELWSSLDSPLRKEDSNPRSLSREIRLSGAREVPGAVKTGKPRKASFVLRGTKGSNPSPSSGESVSLPELLSSVENLGFPRGCAGWLGDRGGQRRAGCFKIAPTGGNISVAPYSSTAVPLMGSAECHAVPDKIGAFGELGRA